MLRTVFCVALAVVPVVTSHGTITHPPMRQPVKGKEYCPWCQGSQNKCDPSASTACAPPTPCWGGIPGTTIPNKYFGKWKDAMGPEGTPWIDQHNTSQHVPVWCPGDTITTHKFVTADHNGCIDGNPNLQLQATKPKRASPTSQVGAVWIRIQILTIMLLMAPQS
jgi:hypothetical protein